MIIIDKNKDYYDYLQGVIGQDPKAVFDRRGSVLLNKEKTPIPFKALPADSPTGYIGTITLLCGLVGHLIYFENFPKQDFQFREYWSRCVKRETDIPLRMRIRYFEHKNNAIKPFIEIEDIILSKAFPYAFGSKHEDDYFTTGKEKWYNEYTISYVNPILSTLPCLFLKPEIIFDELHEFLLSLNDKPIIDGRTDIQKLESAGFDKTTSFRNIK